MWQVLVLLVISGALVLTGLLFVNHSLYKDFEGKDPIVQVGEHLIMPHADHLQELTNQLGTLHCRACLLWYLHCLQICCCSFYLRSWVS